MKSYYSNLILCVTFSIIFLLSACRKDPKVETEIDTANSFSSAVADKWFDLERDMVWTTPGFTPPVVARAFGYTSLTLYEAVRPGIPGSGS